MKAIKTLLVSIFGSICFLLAIAIVSIIVVYFGHGILGPELPGSDNGNFITLASWLYKWFPSIPFWYPQQGGGVSFTAFYPILGHLIVVVIAKVFSISVNIAFRYYSLVALVLTSAGIYLVSFRFTKNQIISGLAAIIYPLSPIAWIFLLGWGFAAEQLSYVFVAPAIVFFDLFISGVIENKNNFSHRLYLLLFLLFSVLCLLSHPLTFSGLISLLIPYCLIYPLFYKNRQKGTFRRSIIAGFLSIGLAVILSLFTLVPFFRYQNIVKQGSATGAVDQSQIVLILQNSIYFKSFFSLDTRSAGYSKVDDKILDISGFGWHNVCFPVAVSLFALIGLVGAYFLNKKFFSLALASAVPTFLGLFPQVSILLYKLPILVLFSSWRSLLMSSRFILPILAAFGCYAIGYLALYPIKYLSLKLRQKFLKLSFLSLFVIATSILTIIIAIAGFYYFKNWKNNPSYLISYGPDISFKNGMLDLRKIWGKETDPQVRAKLLVDQFSVDKLLAKLKLENVQKEILVGGEGVKKFVNKLPDSNNTRLDLSPGLGGITMVLPYYINVPELGVYYNQSSLMPLFWNYQITAFYSPSDVWSEPGLVDELAKYYGIEYSLLPELLTPMKKFSPNTWEVIYKNPNIFSSLGLWRFKEPTGLITATTKPTVLVIGQHRLEVFFRYFNLGNMGGLSYDDALLVDGGENIENYSKDELKNFDIIIMDGYKYKNRANAWDKLNSYVNNGGSLYIDTGWQYSSADWQLNNTPDFFPTQKLSWTDAGSNANFKIETKSISGVVDSGKFSPLNIGGAPWGISSDDKNDMRSWSRTILSASNKPLIAGGNYGNGKVIWTGIDLVGHLETHKNNIEEIKLFHNLMTYLLSGKTTKNIKAGFIRNYPDKISFTFQESSNSKTTLYWREAYEPDFRAKLIENGSTKSIPFYSAGPGLVAFVLPNVSAGTQIVFEYKDALVVVMAKLVSLTLLVLLIIYLFRPEISSKYLAKAKSLISLGQNKAKGQIGNAVKSSNEDIDY